MKLIASLPVANADWSSDALMSCETASADGIALSSLSLRMHLKKSMVCSGETHSLPSLVHSDSPWCRAHRFRPASFVPRGPVPVTLPPVLLVISAAVLAKSSQVQVLSSGIGTPADLNAAG